MEFRVWARVWSFNLIYPTKKWMVQGVFENRVGGFGACGQAASFVLASAEARDQGPSAPGPNQFTCNPECRAPFPEVCHV